MDAEYFRGPCGELQLEDGRWVFARPPVRSFWGRLLAALDVLLGRADALYWDSQ